MTFTDTYNKNAYFPNRTIEIAESQKYRSAPFVKITLYPIQFNPIKKKLKCYKSITYKVSYNNNTLRSQNRSLTNNIDILLNTASNSKYITINSELTDADNENIEPNYIIISTNKYAEAVNKLKNWKQTIGFKCVVFLSYTWTYETVKKNNIRPI